MAARECDLETPSRLSLTADLREVRPHRSGRGKDRSDRVDGRPSGIVREADARADALVAQARQRAVALVPAVPAAPPEPSAP